MDGGSSKRELSGCLLGIFPGLPGSLVCGRVEGGGVGVGGGHARPSCVVGRNRRVSLCLGSSILRRGGGRCSFTGTPARLSVLCRSRGVVLVSGRPKLLYRPSNGRCATALVTTIGHELFGDNR